MTNQRLKGISGLICLKFSRGGFNAHKELTTTTPSAHTCFHCCEAVRVHWNTFGYFQSSAPKLRNRYFTTEIRTRPVWSLLFKNTATHTRHRYFPAREEAQPHLRPFLTFNLRDLPTVSSPSSLGSSSSTFSSK